MNEIEAERLRAERQRLWREYFDSFDADGEPTKEPPPYDPADLADEEIPF
jgi:hypothetical protein